MDHDGWFDLFLGIEAATRLMAEWGIRSGADLVIIACADRAALAQAAQLKKVFMIRFCLAFGDDPPGLQRSLVPPLLTRCLFSCATTTSLWSSNTNLRYSNITSCSLPSEHQHVNATTPWSTNTNIHNTLTCSGTQIEASKANQPVIVASFVAHCGSEDCQWWKDYNNSFVSVSTRKLHLKYSPVCQACDARLVAVAIRVLYAHSPICTVAYAPVSYAYSLICTVSYAHRLMCTQSNMHSLICTQSHMHTVSHAHSPICTVSYAHSLICTQSYMHSLICTPSHMHTVQYAQSICI